jgi:hypothetical protein
MVMRIGNNGGEVVRQAQTNFGLPQRITPATEVMRPPSSALTRAPTAAREWRFFAAQWKRLLVDFDNSCGRPPIRGDHGAAQLGGEQPRRFVGAERELPSQLQRGNSSGIYGYQIGRPKPDGQRRFRAVQDRPRRGGRLFTTGSAFVSETLAAVWPAFLVATAKTPEADRPAHGEQPGRTGVFVGKAARKIDERREEIGHDGNSGRNLCS